MAISIEQWILAVITGTLFAIVYSLRILVLMERRLASVEGHIERLTERLVREESRIEKKLGIKSKRKKKK